jgi:hypothetical protein
MANRKKSRPRVVRGSGFVVVVSIPLPLSRSFLFSLQPYICRRRQRLFLGANDDDNVAYVTSALAVRLVDFINTKTNKFQLFEI